MSIEQVRTYFKALGIEERIREFPVSSATVELAAAALGCEGCRIAKTLSFSNGSPFDVTETYISAIKPEINSKIPSYSKGSPPPKETASIPCSCKSRTKGINSSTLHKTLPSLVEWL